MSEGEAIGHPRDRIIQTIQIMRDKDMSVMEKARFASCWVVFEATLVWRNSAAASLDKWGTRYNQKIDILNFRKSTLSKL